MPQRRTKKTSAVHVHEFIVAKRITKPTKNKSNKNQDFFQLVRPNALIIIYFEDR